MSEVFDVVVAGHLCLDVIPRLTDSFQGQFEKMLLPGHTLIVDPVTFCTGGPVSNTGLALSKLGIPIQLMGKVGDDLLGQAVREIINSYGPHLVDGIVVDETVDTSYTIVISPPGVDRLFLHCPGANDTFSAADVGYGLLSETRLFHFGYPPVLRLMFENDGVQLVEVFRRAKETGVTTSLDMSLPASSSAAGRADWATILKSTLPYVDVFLPSAEEVLFMLHRETLDNFHQTANGGDILPMFTPSLLTNLSRELLELGAKIVCIKLGHRGFYIHTADQPTIEKLGRAQPSNPAEWANRQMWTPAFKVEKMGTTGAGDASIAGFLSALLRSMSPEETLTIAAAVGACNVEATDSLSGIRPWDETLRRVQNGWPKHDLLLDAPGWHFDEHHQLWMKE